MNTSNSKAVIIPNSFTSYSLSDEAVIEGSILTIGQTQVLQNLLATTAEQKLALEYDVANPNSFIQEEARLKGWIECLRYQLDTSVATIENRANPSYT